MPSRFFDELHGTAIADVIRRVRLSFEDVALLEQRSKKTIQNLVAAGRYPVPVHTDSCGRRYFLAVDVMKHLCGITATESKVNKRGRPRKTTPVPAYSSTGGGR